MARSYWKKSLVTSLAWAGLAWGQNPVPSPTPVPAAATPERTLTVREEGRPPQKCRLVRSWQTPEGAKAYQVQALDSGEMITILDGGAAGGSMRIFHWGQAKVPPAGAPVAPAAPAPTAAAPAAPAPTASAPTRPAVAAQEAVRVPAPVKPVVPPQPEVVRTPAAPAPVRRQASSPYSPTATSSPYGATPAPVIKAPAASTAAPAPPTKPTTSALVSPSAPGGTGLRAVSPPSSVVSSTTVTPGQPVTLTTPPTTPAPVVVKSTTTTPYAVAPAMTAAPAMQTTPPAVVQKMPPVTPVPSLPAMGAPKAASYQMPTSLAEARAYGPPRGREDETGPAAPWSAKPDQPAAAKVADKPAKVEVLAAPASDWRKSWGKSEEVSVKPVAAPASPKAPSVSTPPVSVVRGPADPLQKPEVYSKPAVAPVVSAHPTVIKDESAVPLPDSHGVLHTPEVGGQAPLGIQSVLAASAGNPAAITQLPVPTVTIPPARHPVTTPKPAPPPPPVHEDLVNAFTPPNMGAPMMPVPPANQALANAFAPGQMASQPVAPPPHPTVTPAVYNTGMDRRQPAPSAPASQQYGPGSKSPQEMLASLRDALAPSEREWAAEGLARLDARSHPEAVGALLAAAREDPAPLVRVSCIRGLVRMKANTPAVRGALETLKGDGDTRVRQEAEQALTHLAGSAATDRRVR
jgi:hypothetical protein